MKTLLFTLIASFCFILLPSAHAGTIVFKPLELFYLDDPVSLGTGSLESIADEPDFYKPDNLIEHEGRLSFWYERESILNEEEAIMRSYTRGVSGLFHLKLPASIESAFGFSITDFDAGSRIIGEHVFDAQQDISEKVVSFSVRPFPFISAGVGLQLRTDWPDTEGFYGISVGPFKNMTFGFRQYSRNLDIASSLHSNGHIARFAFSPEEKIRELNFQIDIPFFVRIDASSNMNNLLEDNEIDFIVFPDKQLQIGFHYLKRPLDYSSTIFIDDSDGGHIDIGEDFKSRSFVLRYRKKGSSNEYFAGIKRIESMVQLNGIVGAESIMDFWTNLVAGDRFFIADYSLRSSQYHMGMEYIYSERMVFRAGLQYIDVRPGGELEHWTPYPFIKLGKLDSEVIPINYTKATFAGLSCGFSYRFRQVELSYGISQLVPISVRTEDGTVTEDITEERSDFGELWEKIKRDPGGNFQQFKVAWYF